MRKFLFLIPLLFSMQMVHAESVKAADKNHKDSVFLIDDDFEKLTDKAKMGNVNAQTRLGFDYYEKHNYLLASQWLEKASQNNSGIATFTLADMYLNGKGKSKDTAKGIALLEKSYQQGFLSAYLLLGALYKLGKGVEKNDELAMSKFLPIAKDSVTAAIAVESDYCHKQSKFFNQTQCTDWHRVVMELLGNGNTFLGLIHRAKLGLRDAQMQLADAYRLGLYNNQKIPVDYQQAYFWYKKASEQGDDNALYFLGKMNFNGIGTQKNDKQAIDYYRFSANQGNIYAMNDLGYLYKNGLAVEQNFTTSKNWYQKSCDNGNQLGCENYQKLIKQDN